MSCQHHPVHVRQAATRGEYPITLTQRRLLQIILSSEDPDLITPTKQLPDVSKKMVLDNNEGRGNFKGVNVGVEGVYKIEHSKRLSKQPQLAYQTAMTQPRHTHLLHGRVGCRNKDDKFSH